MIALIEAFVSLMSGNIRYIFNHPKFNWTPPPEDIDIRTPLEEASWDDDYLLDDTDQIQYFKVMDYEPRTWMRNKKHEIKDFLAPQEEVIDVQEDVRIASTDTPTTPRDLINWGPKVPKWKLLAEIVELEHIIGLNKSEFDREL